MKLNYQLELDKVLDSIDKNQKPSLLLHSCCAPCSSYVLEYLSSYFNIIILYYNPNIDEEDEFNKRVKELEKLIKLMNLSIKVINNGHRHEDFKEISSGLEDEPEGGKRCFKCYRLRLLESVSTSFAYPISIPGRYLSLILDVTILSPLLTVTPFLKY